MSLHKAIRYSKEYRKPYRRSKSFDRTCRNHGSCKFCELNRTYKNRMKKRIAEEKLKEYYNGRDYS